VLAAARVSSLSGIQSLDRISASALRIACWRMVPRFSYCSTRVCSWLLSAWVDSCALAQASALSALWPQYSPLCLREWNRVPGRRPASKGLPHQRHSHSRGTGAGRFLDLAIALPSMAGTRHSQTSLNLEETHTRRDMRGTS